MKCPCCKEQLACAVSIEKAVSPDQKQLVPDKKVVRYRKYKCPKCASTYTTQEICDTKQISIEGKKLYTERKNGK